MKAVITIDNQNVELFFTYSETCKNVYKKFTVIRDGKNTNITWLKNRISVNIPDICTANTYFWMPANSADNRRRNEENRIQEVKDFFLAIGATMSDTEEEE